MLSISYHGDAGLTLIYKNLNTATSLDTSFIKPTYTHYVPFYSGGTYTIVAGNTITQDASTAVVDSVVLTGGTWAGGDAIGILWLSSVSGTFVSGNLSVGENANVASIDEDIMAFRYTGTFAEAMLITLEESTSLGDAGINISHDGSVPTLSTGSNRGMYLDGTRNYALYGRANIERLKFINRSTDGGAIVKIVIFY